MVDSAPKCKRCGKCLAICPVYLVTRDEKLSPRGRLALIDSFDENRLRADFTFRNALSACLLCGNCDRKCPNNVAATKEILIIRAKLARLPLRLIEKFIANPKRMDSAVSIARIADNLPSDSGLLLRFTARSATSPKIAPASLTELFPNPVGPEDGTRISLFPGCMTNYIQIKTGRAAIESLAAAGYRVSIIKDSGCCGQVALAAGLKTQAQDRIRSVAESLKFEKNDPEFIVFVCSTCQSRVQDALPEYYPSHPPLLDFAQAILKKLPELDQINENVSYHDPCHTLNPDSSHPDEARKLLSKLPGLKFVETNQNPTCCGQGGLFAASHPDTSIAIGKIKADILNKSNIDKIATSCPACLLRLTDLAKSQNYKAVHISELVHSRLKKSKTV